MFFIPHRKAQAYVTLHSFEGVGVWNFEVFHPGSFFYVTLSDWYPPCFRSTLTLQGKTATASSIVLFATLVLHAKLQPLAML